MKKFKKLIFLSAFILVNIFALSAATEVATIVDAKKLASNTNVIFTGDLTLQYVSNAGSDYYAFDDNGDFIRLRCYNWSVLTEIFSLSKGDKIKIPGEVTYVNDANNCVTFDIDATSVRSIISVGSGDVKKPIVTTIKDLKNDVNKNYGAGFIELQNVKIESIVDFYISPSPITKIVVGDDSIDFSMDVVETNFPSVADVSGFVCYEKGNPKLFIPQIAGYIEASAYDNIAAFKLLTNQDGYDDLVFDAIVLVTNVQKVGNDYIYFVQQNGVDDNPVAMQMVVSDTLNLVYQVGDSVSLNVKGRYLPVYYEEINGALTKMSSATFIVKNVENSKLLSSDNTISILSFDDVLADNGWIKYDNCLAITNVKGEVVIDDSYTSIGCIGLKMKDELHNKNCTIPIVNTYYEEVGSPKNVIVCGFVCGYKVGEESYAVLMPRSKKDFLSEIVEFDNIADLKAAGRTPSRAISYKLNNSLVITGFTSKRDAETKKTFYTIFVQDSTSALQLNHESSKLQNGFKVGDVINGVIGYYASGGRSYVNGDTAYFASAATIDIKTEHVASIVFSEEQYKLEPIVISISELDDSYASQLITIKNITYRDSVNLVLNGETMNKPIVSQKDSWMIVSDKFEYEAEMGSITGVYYLSGVNTQIIPRSQEDVVFDGYSDEGSNNEDNPGDDNGDNGEIDDAIDNVSVDNNLFVKDNILYAEGAMIEVYDVMGRLIVVGSDWVNVSDLDGGVMLVKTIYANNAQFVTKLINK